ncbi:hypothetical protein GRX03_12450 [Halovenus sp. WSH3]|uniref:Uncharacterized protein n=1 Tax=Halovenus carboxidivorans TaxID=2692199 RepID=A0A6B0TB17_9EURY|nr:hypothetical protein [Halovenus carboxidivorans]MXR52411.1 hypothetical protein [Halovenus carboxidivorans]
MEYSGDEVAGVVDSFEALTRAELRQALAELAFKRGEDAEPGEFDEVIDEAIRAYQLIRIEGEQSLLVVGPAAFPVRPEGTADLQHILDVEDRDIDRERAGEAAVERVREEAALAVEMGDTDTIEALIDVSYEIESWAPVDVADLRTYLDERA